MPSRSRVRLLLSLAVFATVIGVFGCLADRSLRPQRAFWYPLPALPDSEPGHEHGAIVGLVLDSASREPIPGWGVALYWNDDPPLALLKAQSTWVYNEAGGGFGVYHVPLNTRGYRIKCVAPDSRTIWSRRLAIRGGAVDTVVCLMQPSDPRKPEGPYQNWTPC